MSMSVSSVRSEIEERARAVRAEGREPLAIFDLDGTLYDNAPRTLRILREFAHAYAEEVPELVATLRQLTTDRMVYRVSDTLRQAGITDAELIARVEAYWFERFFTDAYELYDLPMPGAVPFVQRLYGAGVVPTYLTGRDAPNMLSGTVASLQRDGFPIGTCDTRLILKDAFETPDDVYKASVVTHLARVGAVVAAFDNEPGLCNLFKEAFPSAVVCWLDTSCAPNPPPLREDVITVNDFLPLLAEHE
jgi:hypothetical protein